MAELDADMADGEDDSGNHGYGSTCITIRPGGRVRPLWARALPMDQNTLESHGRARRCGI